MTTPLTLPDIPRAALTDGQGNLPIVWQNFFRALFERVGRTNQLSNTEIADILAYPGLIPSRLVKTDGNREFRSVTDLTEWITGASGKTLTVSTGDGRVIIHVLESGMDHNLFANLTTGDAHTQYVLLLGRGAGQTIKGGADLGGSLTLSSTAHATKGKIILGNSAYDEANNRLGIGTATPGKGIDVKNSAVITGAADQLLTGTSLPTMSGTVYGTGTLFTTELSIGNVIVIDGQEATVSGFTSNTEMAVAPDIGVYGTSDIRRKQTVTGTASTASSTAVVGSGTLFLTEFVAGDIIRVNEQERVVNVVSDDTHLSVTAAFTITAPGSTIIKKRLLTGTANAVPSATVKGSGTKFTTELTPGDVLLIFGEALPVATIVSDTELTIGGYIPFTSTGPSVLWKNSPVLLARTQSGANRMVLSWQGNVGIGTMYPRYMLSFGTELYDSTSMLALYENGGTNAYGFGVSAGSLDFWTSGAVHASLNDAGKFGIGCTPLQQFQMCPNTSNSTGSPRAISMGGDYSNSPGVNLKLRLYDDNAGTIVGLGVSAGQLDFGVPTGTDYVFYVNGSEIGRWGAGGLAMKAGPSVLSGSAYVPYGSMYAVAGTITCAVANAGEWYYIGTGLSDGGSSNSVTFQNSKELKALVAGKYLVNWSATVQCATAGQNIMGGVMVNSSMQSSGASGADLAANTNGTLGGSCVVSLAVNDLVRIGISNQTAVNDVIVNHANLTIVQIGG